MKRIVQPELLDELPQTDPRAIQSRRDLRRVNFLMGNAGIVERLLLKIFPGNPPKRMVELGAGDATFMLRLASRLAKRWKNVEIIFVDQQKLVSPKTEQAIHQLGWRTEIISADVFHWLPICEPSDCIITNLLLHHFASEKLSRLLRESAAKTETFIACEPHRSAWGIFGTKFLWAIGCNDVTRHDAPASVRAGFRDLEISQFWPRSENWELEEVRAGLFSHVFAARLCSRVS